MRVVNLLAFHGNADGAAGATAYRRDSAATAGAFGRAGERLVASQSVVESTGLDAPTDWNRVVVTEYPNGPAPAAMWLDDEFVAGRAHREAGVLRSIATFSVLCRV